MPQVLLTSSSDTTPLNLSPGTLKLTTTEEIIISPSVSPSVPRQADQSGTTGHPMPKSQTPAQPTLGVVPLSMEMHHDPLPPLTAIEEVITAPIPTLPINLNLVHVEDRPRSPRKSGVDPKALDTPSAMANPPSPTTPRQRGRRKTLDRKPVERGLVKTRVCLPCKIPMEGPFCTSMLNHFSKKKKKDLTGIQFVVRKPLPSQ